jgi:hypothetical protein
MTEDAKFAKMLAGWHYSAMLSSCAIVAALAERGAVDVLKVADWADFFSGNYNQGEHIEPETRAVVSANIKSFAALLRAMNAKPPGAGRG